MTPHRKFVCRALVSPLSKLLLCWCRVLLHDNGNAAPKHAVTDDATVGTHAIFNERREKRLFAVLSLAPLLSVRKRPVARIPLFASCSLFQLS